MARIPRPSKKLPPNPLRPRGVPSTGSETERDHAGGPGIYHPEVSSTPHSPAHGVGPFIQAYAFVGVMEFAFRFSMKTFSESNGQTPGMRRVKTLKYTSPLAGTPHFVALNSLSGRFLKDTGELVDRPLGAFEVSAWIKEPGTLACAVRLSDKNSDDPVEVNVRGVIVFFQ